MKIVKSETDIGTFLLKPEGSETLSDIAVSVIVASYETAFAVGLGRVLRPNETELTDEMAIKMLKGEDVSHDYCNNPNKTNEVYMDYVFGRQCKTFVKIMETEKQVKVRISPIDRNPDKIIKYAVELLKVRNAKRSEEK